MSDSAKGCAVVLGLIAALIIVSVWGIWATTRSLDDYRRSTSTKD